MSRGVINQAGALQFRRIGNYYAAIDNDVAASSGVILADHLYATVFPVLRTATFDKIGIEIDTLEAGKSAYLGIYEDDGNGYPAGLRVDAGALSLGTAGLQSLTINEQLKAGNLYYLAILGNNTATFKIYYQNMATLWTLGFATALGNQAAVHDWHIAQAYGVLPDPFPASAAGAKQAYAIGLRLASVP